MKDIHVFEPIWENWVIDEKIGSGSYGTVWKAHREDQFSHVRQYAAVKHISIPREDGQGEDDILFPSEETKSQYYRNMLNQLIVEIDAMVSLRGKANIVSYEEHKVIPKDQNSGYDLFLRMELLKSVPKYIKEIKRTLQRNEVIQLGIDIAGALETLENRNFVHRDVKPDNIFIDDEGHFKLGDFGTARVLEATGNASTKAGTPNYMAPEVYTKSVQYDQTVDIYSLGIVLYRYLNNGYLPFMSETEISPDAALVKRIRGEQMQPPCNADAELARIILKACAFEAKDRYQNAKDLKKDLARCQEKQVRDVEVPIVCQTDDGQELFRETKKAKTGSQVTITIEDTPYKQFLNEEKELISDCEVVVVIDEDGRMDPPEASFIWRDFKTVISHPGPDGTTTVVPIVPKEAVISIICRDDFGNELKKDSVTGKTGSKVNIPAPEIEGFKLINENKKVVELTIDNKGKPEQNEVVFVYEKVKQGGKKNKKVIGIIAAFLLLAAGATIWFLTRPPQKYTITWKLEDGSVLASDDAVISGELPEYQGPVPTKAADEQYSYSFAGWTPEMKEATEDAVYEATFGKEIRSYSVVWQDETGETIDKVVLEYGTEPTHEDPVKESDPEFTYMFAGWEPEVKAVTGDIAYRPVFTSERRSYTVTWQNDLGEIIDSDILVYGTEPTHTDPVKESDPEFTYTFTGWEPEVKAVTGDASYKAIFSAKRRSYAITWQDAMGKTIDTTTVEYGAEPTHAEPTKESDPEFDYFFTGWEPEVKAVSGDTVYKAIFGATKRSYTITWQNDAGETIDTAILEYGSEPTYKDPVKESTPEFSYTFAGWEPEVTTVTGDATYKAIFNREIRSYTVTWQDELGETIDTAVLTYGTEPTHTDPAKEADPEFSYTFTGWEPDVQTVTGDATYKATFGETKRSYTITWQNDAEETIDTAILEYGSEPTHEDPVKESTPEFSYTFAGWEPEVRTVTGDATYNATFIPERRFYTVTWQDDLGETIDTAILAYGTEPTHTDAVKEADPEFTYTFTGWEPEVKAVTGDMTYRAVFVPERRSYTVTWQNDLDETIDSAILAYGTEPTHTDPVKEPDEDYIYTFEGWEPEVKTVTGDATYKAVFQKEEIPGWMCINCNTKNSYDDIFCTNCAQTRLCLECGLSMPMGDKFCPNCATEAGTWKCSHCGAILGIDDKECTNCGAERHKPGEQ